MAEQKKKTNGSTKKTTASKSNSSNKSKKKKTVVAGSKVRDEICSLIIIAVGIFLAIAIQTSAAGEVGKILQNFFLGCFGILAYVLPYYLIIYGILLILNKTVHITGRSFAMTFTIFIMLTLLNSVRYIDVEEIKFSFSMLPELFDDGVAKQNGGFIGMLLGLLIAKAIGKSGLIIFALVVIVICVLLVGNTPISQYITKVKIRRAEKAQLRAEADEEYEKQQQELEIERRAAEMAAAKVVAEKGTAKDSVKKSDLDTEKRNKTVFVNEHGKPEFLNDFDGFEEEEQKEVDFTVEMPKSPFDATKIAKSQQNILNYMNDDTLFEEAKPVDYDVMAAETQVADAFVETTVEARNVQSMAGTPAAEPVKKLSKSEAANAMLTAEELNLNSEAAQKPYQFPSIELLNKSKADNKNSETLLWEKARKLEETLHNFHVEAKVSQVSQGPAVTRYEIQPAIGVKVSSIVRLADDIALNLEAKSIRIEAPIPGKAAVGIEVENDKINFVNLRDIIGSKQFKEAKSKISFAVGKDISGNAVVGDLKGMPHMLIAGSTGSGKSVCVNSIILSILYKAKPEEVKLVLIDPKVVELGNYNGIPHLLIPVVTEPGKAAAALNWAVAEMTDRYRKFAEEGVRDLESFNQSAKAKGEDDRYMPQVVIIIDELADLMMAAPSQVEESICRLAQMARAAGMHLIVATQRPSVDVVTGVIKANIPSRIAFAVSSQVDSRTIIDMAGAEKLVGKGDMLYNPLGMGKPVRVQGAFVSDEEVNKVIEHVKSQGHTVEYSADVIHSIEKSNVSVSDEEDGDELLADAIDLVVQAGQASVSMLQRRFRIGYNRAARIVDMMEARGIVGPADGSRPRQVLVSEEELREWQEETREFNLIDVDEEFNN